MIEGMRKYIAEREADFSLAETHLAAEVLSKLGDLDALCSEIVQLNSDAVRERLALLPTGEQMLETLRTLALSGADPSLVEWFSKNPNPQLLGEPAFSSGWPLADEPSDMARLRRDTEGYYHAAHRVGKILALLPGLKKFKCNEIAIIRNKLVEHPDGKDSRVLLPSFGVSDRGPVIKPLRQGDAQLHQDMGFYVNAAAFLLAVEQVLDSACGS